MRQQKGNETDDRLSFLKRSLHTMERWSVLLSIIGTIFLMSVYFWLVSKSKEPAGLLTWQELLLDLIPELLGTLVVIGLSFVFLRLLQEVRNEKEILEISKKISEELSDKMPDIEGISKLKLGREGLATLTPMEELIRRSQSDISLLATQHGYVVKQQLKLLGEMAGLGRKIKILMMSPFDETGAVNPLVQKYEVRYTNYKGTQYELETNKQRLQDWYNSLSNDAKKNVYLRVHFDLPVGNIILIDSNEDSGVVQVEPYIFANVDVGELVVYVVHRKISERFFELHVRTFNWLWERGKCIVSLTGDEQSGGVEVTSQ